MQQRDRDSGNAGAFDGGLNQTDGLHVHRSNGRQERHVNPVGPQLLGDLWRCLCDQTLWSENRTHEAEVAVIHRADFAARDEFTKAIHGKGQIAISLDPGMIEGVTLMRFDQGTAVRSTG